jgi:hypothetical protein
MSIKTAEQIGNRFKDKPSWLNVMGGEITLLPNYPELLHVLAFAPMRVVTNGWWVDHKAPREKLVSTINTLNKEKTSVLIGVSRDRFHPEGVGDRAFYWLKSRIDLCNTVQDLKEEDRAVAPVGRAWWNQLGDPMLRLFGAFCRSRENHRSMTVLEDGTVTYCPYGAWPVGSLDDDFEELEATRKRIDKVFISNCVSCWQSWEFTGKQKFAEENAS